MSAAPRAGPRAGQDQSRPAGARASGPTAFTSCAPFFRPSRWRTRWISPSRPARKTAIALEDPLRYRRQPGGRARRGWCWMRCASPAGSRCGSTSASRWARGWAADRRRGGGAAGAARAGRAGIRRCRAVRTRRSSSAATCRSSCWAARRRESAAERSFFRCPTRRARQGVLVAPGIHVNTAQAYRDLSPRLTTELQQNKIVSFQSLTWERGVWLPAETILKRWSSNSIRRLATLKEAAGSGGCDRGPDDGQRLAPCSGCFRTVTEFPRASKLLGDDTGVSNFAGQPRALSRACGGGH